MFQTDLGKRSTCKTLCSYIHNGPFTLFLCICVCVCKHTDVRLRCVCECVCICACVCMYAFRHFLCVYSWWLVASRTAFIRININMCLSCSPSHPCPSEQSVRGRPLSSWSDCQWTWRKVRQQHWLACWGQTIRLIQLKPAAMWRKVWKWKTCIYLCLQMHHHGFMYSI